MPSFEGWLAIMQSVSRYYIKPEPKETDTTVLDEAPGMAEQEARDLWRPGWSADEAVQFIHHHGDEERLRHCLQALRSSTQRADQPRRSGRRFGRR